jgi:cytochrome c-type biogenesis protein
MNMSLRVVAIFIVLAAAATVLLWSEETAPAKPPATVATTPEKAQEKTNQPTLLEFGGSKCTMCKLMAPVLKGLENDFAGQLKIEKINTQDDPDTTMLYSINSIPTQVFLGSDGVELDRHIGFYSRKEILAKWSDLGYSFNAPASDVTNEEAPEACHEESAMAGLTSKLSEAVKGAPLIALGASLLWGILSVLLSPCHLASVPLIVGFVDSEGQTSTRRAFTVASLFSLGILVTIAIMGGIATLLGRMMGDVGGWVYYFVAVVFFAMGLILMDVLPQPWPKPKGVGYKGKGLLAALILGLVFGVALGPCTFSYMIPIFSVTYALAGTAILYGYLLIAAYAIGHCGVIVVAGTSAQLVQKYLNWNEKSKGTAIIKRACGILVIGGGLYLLYMAR